MDRYQRGICIHRGERTQRIWVGEFQSLEGNILSLGNPLVLERRVGEHHKKPVRKEFTSSAQGVPESIDLVLCEGDTVVTYPRGSEFAKAYFQALADLSKNPTTQPTVGSFL